MKKNSSLRHPRIEVLKGSSPNNSWFNIDFWISQDSIFGIFGTQNSRRTEELKSKFGSKFHNPFYFIHRFWGSSATFPCSSLFSHQFVSSFTHINSHTTSHADTNFWFLITLQFHCLCAYDSKAEKATKIPATIDVRKRFSLGGVRVSTFHPFTSLVFVKSPPPVTKPMPFRFASSSCARPVASSDD